MMLGTNYIISGLANNAPISTGANPVGVVSTPAPIPIESPITNTPAPPSTVVTSTTAGPTVTGGSSGMNDAVPTNGSLFQDLANLLTPSAPATVAGTAPTAAVTSSNWSWLIWAGVGLGVYFAFFRK